MRPGLIVLRFARLREKLWLVPAVMTVGCAALAFGLVALDVELQTQRLASRWPLIFGDSPDGARVMLVGIAGAMITVLGVVFSITVVTLSLASNQYTSRILRNFVRDRGNHVALGIFVAAFVYCLVVLRTIRGDQGEAFVPTLAVLGGLVIAIVAAATLIYFIHHVAISIQASEIISRAAQESLRAIDRTFPAPVPEAPHDREHASPATATRAVAARRTGYLQAIELERLDQLGRAHGTIDVHRAVGDFVREGGILATVDAERAADDDDDDIVDDRIQRAFHVGSHRTVEQDVGYGIQQLVDIALKALSPGINDTTTAVICVDWIGAVLDRLASRDLDLQARRRCCVLLRPPSFAGFAELALAPIRQHGAGNAAVLTRLAEVLRELAPATPANRAVLEHHLRLVLDTARRTLPVTEDVRHVELAGAAIGGPGVERDRARSPLRPGPASGTPPRAPPASGARAAR